MPALFWRFLDKQIDEESNIILCDKNLVPSKVFLSELKDKCKTALRKKDDNLSWKNFLKIIKIIEVDVVSGSGHIDLLKIIKQVHTCLVFQGEARPI